MSPETQVPPRRAPTLLGDLGNFKSASLSLVNDGKMGMNVQIFGNLCQGANNSLEDIDCFLLSQNCLLMGAWFFCLFFFFPAKSPIQAAERRISQTQRSPIPLLISSVPAFSL